MSTLKKIWIVIVHVTCVILGVVVWLLSNKRNNASYTSQSTVDDNVEADRKIDSIDEEIRRRDDEIHKDVVGASRPGGLESSARRNFLDSIRRRRNT